MSKHVQVPHSMTLSGIQCSWINANLNLLLALFFVEVNFRQFMDYFSGLRICLGSDWSFGIICWLRWVHEIQYDMLQHGVASFPLYHRDIAHEELKIIINLLLAHPSHRKAWWVEIKHILTIIIMLFFKCKLCCCSTSYPTYNLCFKNRCWIFKIINLELTVYWTAVQ